MALKRSLSDRAGEARSLNNIGELYLAEDDFGKALPWFSRTLQIREDIGDRSGESVAHYNLGLIYRQRHEYREALHHLGIALAVQFELREPNLLWRIYDDPSRVYAAQDQPAPAIFYGKLAVNTLQSVRSRIRDLDASLQHSYLADKIDAYKHLASIVLDQGRVLEAQRVLDLLKIQELQHYFQDIRGGKTDYQNVPLHPQEMHVLESHEDLLHQAVLLGRELGELLKIALADRTAAQEQRIRELRAAQAKITADFIGFIENPAVIAMFRQLSSEVRARSLALKALRALEDNLPKMGQHPVLL